MKKVLALILALSMCATLFVACGNSNSDSGAGETKGSVYYLNFKPEVDELWQQLAATYTEQTGVPVTVVTAASGQYETTLKSEIAKTEAPTLFQINGPVGLEGWKDYCYDLSGTELYKQLTSKDFALENNGEVAAVAFAIETYGIIYNKAILNKYFALDGAVVKSVDEINNFETFKKVVEDIQSKKDALGIDGAFTSSGLHSSSDWRFKTHLANLPIYYEYKDEGITSSDAIKGTYLDNYKAIWDLYINNATCKPSLLSAKTGDDAVAEFVTEKAVFYQNGTWAYNDVKDLGDENIGMMPIYIGAKGEENQALCTGSENYWCINKKASQEDIDATIAFVEWVITSNEGRQALGPDMGNVTPFKTFTEEYVPDNQFIKDANAYIAAGKAPVSWTFTTMPSEEWKNGVGSALLEYSQGTGSWDKVKTAFIDGWVA